MPKSTRLIVVTADQISSRRADDHVPAALDALADVPALRAFSRTAGDEIQGIPSDAESAVDVVEHLVRLGDWRIGVGVGAVEHPLPTDVRAGRGPAYLAAREAITRAHNAPQSLAVDADGADAESAQAILRLLALVWRRRTPAGWAAVDAVTSNTRARRRTGQQVADHLGVTPSAVSQRLSTAAHEEAKAGRLVAIDMLAQLVGAAG